MESSASGKCDEYFLTLSDGDDSELLEKGDDNFIKFEGFNKPLSNGTSLKNELADKVAFGLDQHPEKEATYKDGTTKGVSPNLLMKEGKYLITIGLAPTGKENLNQVHKIQIEFDVDYKLEW